MEKNIVDLTSVDNVIESIVLSIHSPSKALNNTYNITDGNPVILWDSINTVLKGIGKEQVNKTVKFRVAYLAASILEWVSWITKKEPSLTKYSVGVLSKKLHFRYFKSNRFIKL